MVSIRPPHGLLDQRSARVQLIECAEGDYRDQRRGGLDTPATRATRPTKTPTARSRYARHAGYSTNEDPQPPGLDTPATRATRPTKTPNRPVSIRPPHGLLDQRRPPTARSRYARYAGYSTNEGVVSIRPLRGLLDQRRPPTARSRYARHTGYSTNEDPQPPGLDTPATRATRPTKTPNPPVSIRPLRGLLDQRSAGYSTNEVRATRPTKQRATQATPAGRTRCGSSATSQRVRAFPAPRRLRRRTRPRAPCRSPNRSS
ncbi:hypothetical protein FB389_0362 [Rarobacter incanus]|uniref:Uncharacterized protein n=1 Tax=Rarobacter incanus TaxID=153494 RepID=A0A542SMD3_9MICO|nr:hypothetical protein FB389_0362 [Rarobacter incanus]